jgi:putative N6-adenine-specific DNA methylase
MPSFQDTAKNSTILVTCPKGLSAYCANELESLSIKITSRFPTGVSLRGSFSDCMMLNLSLSTAHHVLFHLKEFTCKTPEDLYKETLSIDWEHIVPANGYVSVTSVVHTASINDTRFANLKCKDAIADRLVKQTGKRCDSGNQRDRTVVHLYWNDDRCIIYLDTSGEPLSKRGYRFTPGSAPMQETLAAAVVRTTGWDGSTHLVNPMCGSGTLAIEAALIGLHRAPGIMRTNFGFMHIMAFDPDAYAHVRKKLISLEKNAFTGTIRATDNDPAVLSAAQRNAKAAGVESSIEFGLCDFKDSIIPEGKGTVIFNPEYGIRMGDATELQSTYKDIGDFFKRRCSGYTGFVFTGNFDLAKYIGLKARKKYQFVSGKIECRLYEYELYEGRK